MKQVLAVQARNSIQLSESELETAFEDVSLKLPCGYIVWVRFIYADIVQDLMIPPKAC